MPASSQVTSSSKATPLTAAQAVIDALLRCGISCGFGIPSIHNIALYDALRQTSGFHHWIVRHEQAAVFAADGFCRRSGKPAAVLASTGPGNLFTVAPLLESFQTSTPLVLIGTNVASSLLGKTCGALHEIPQQLEIIKPLTRFAARVTSPDAIPETVAAAAQAGGPAFIEVPHDLLLAPVTAPGDIMSTKPAGLPSSEEIARAAALIGQSRKPVIVAGSDVIEGDATVALQNLAERLQSPVFTTTSGKGAIADDHALAMGCISRLGVVQELLAEADLLLSVGARLTEFDTGRFTLQFPSRHIQIDKDPTHAGLPLPAECRLAGDLN